MWYTDEYTSGQRDKELKSYYKSGALKRIERFSEFKSQGGECFEEDGKPKTFSSFESIPQYPGGEEGLIRYLIGAIQYPALARENDITGTVVVQFVVNRDGTVSDVQVVKDIGGGCGAEAARVVLAMPDWIPGYLDDKPVRVRYTLPVRFNLEPAKKKKRKKS
ncbi:MAG: energy transducer TonB [Lewinellaceae bacterium]|nr:energy transducer TonB [Lewinellaceae bacterium]